MKIYTKKGDSGYTGLLGGGRVPKSDPVLCVLGDLDEFNACLGTAIVHANGSSSEAFLKKLQSTVFDVGAEIASTDGRFAAKGVEAITLETEEWIDRLTEQMPELKNFVLPGGTILSADLHLARTVCRRAERSLSSLAQQKRIRPEVTAFVNRISDWLFCAARFANHEAGVKDVVWTGGNQE